MESLEREILRKVNRISLSIKLNVKGLTIGEIEKLKSFLEGKGFYVKLKNNVLNASKTLSRK